ncbi:aminoglycoside 2'-N-acetyltransferase I [Streptomyces sp. 2224.1]|nr:aminoglycoside 2'-N-acetyltransferase I [Streptomyces sp. 2321.6]SDR12438.1 aminoglycoside 2'-N-acetyltransferase I [Streptomyces sp. KS_16]SED71339.1 aminoglycoside 2'-N-acetyltransferase I [Streptomyces sp. 2133.1]SEE35242.1 aminoglycoside 2'-N-acetyltransferase I [Streptomyces sp. 2224.1]SNC72064.1 aminoglycoside 2'-N-acetyltransferase I [Streptomyces sp. 2114.4]
MPSPDRRPTATMPHMTEAQPTTPRRTDVRLAHTAELDPATLKAARVLLHDVFDDMTAEDWEHALGGLHALVHEDGALIGHASVVQRRLLHDGRALRCGYVEGVGVRADRRGRGHGAAMMDALERVIRRGYDLGALGAADEAAPFYAARGWQLWRGPSWALTPDGIRRTADEDGCIYVLPTPACPLDLNTDLTCDWRDGDVW